MFASSFFVAALASIGASNELAARRASPSSASSASTTPPFDSAAIQTSAASSTRAPDAKPAAARDVSALLEPVRVAQNLPGLVGLTLDHGRVVALGATGLRKSGDTTKLRATDRMHLGSCTKAMTATLCALLVQEGKLHWDSTLASVFPERADAMHEAWRAVTLEQLLQHRSGAPANVKYERVGAPLEQRERLLRAVTKTAPPNAPGTHYEYSNVGYALAGHMAEHASGVDYETLITQRLFTPLGIESAGFGAPGLPELVSEPRGHLELGLAIEPGPAGDNPPAIAPAGTVHMALEDWAKFIALHVAGDRDGWKDASSGAALLPPEAFVKLHTPAEGGEYALGWIVTKREWAGGTALTHSGSNTMWFCTAWLAPQREFAFLVATNQGGAKAQQGCDAAIGLLLQEHLKSMTAPK